MSITMRELLGELEELDIKENKRKGVGIPSTGQRNKLSKKTPLDKKSPPNIGTAGFKDKAQQVNNPNNKPAKKNPMKAGVSPPNVRGAVEDAENEIRTFFGEIQDARIKEMADGPVSRILFGVLT